VVNSVSALWATNEGGTNVMYGHGDRRPTVYPTVNEMTLDTIRAPWTCRDGEMPVPSGMPTLFVWQSRWSCRRTPRVENLGPEDCRRCPYWKFESSI